MVKDKILGGQLGERDQVERSFSFVVWFDFS